MFLRTLTAIAAAVFAVFLLPSAVGADDALWGNRLTVAAGFGNHGTRIHVLIRYSVWPPKSCPSMKPSFYDPPEEIKAFWSSRCARYRAQRARLILRIFRISRPHGLALRRDKRVHGPLSYVPNNPFDTGGSWATDVYTVQFGPVAIAASTRFGRR